MVDLPATLEPEVLISWDGTAAFDGPDDDVTDYADAGVGITVEEGLNGARELNPPKVSASGVTLRNGDGRFSQDRATSPVYQRVLPGRPVQKNAYHGVDRLYRDHVLYREHMPYRGRARYTLSLGTIDTITPNPKVGEQTVRLDCLGIEQLLTGAPVTIPVMETPLVSDCIHAVLDAVNWPASTRTIATSDTRLLRFFADEQQPWTLLLQLLAAEGPGAMFVRAGVFHFQNRNYRATATRSITSRATFYDRIDGERTRYRDHVRYRGHRLYRGRTSGRYFTDLQPDTGLKSVYNRATYTTRQRTLGSLTAIWSLGSTLALGSGESVTLIARATSGNPFQEAVTPVLTTDYTVSGGTVSVSLDADSGLVAFIVVTATSGTPTVSGLQLRAKPLTVVGETTVSNGIDASGSIAKFSQIPGQNIPRTMAVNGWPEIDLPNAQAVCDAWVSRYMVQRPAATITLEPTDAETLRLVLDAQVSDRWTLVETNTGLAADVWINWKRLAISKGGGRKVVATFGCEKVEELAGFVWDGPLSLWGTAVWAT